MFVDGAYADLFYLQFVNGFDTFACDVGAHRSMSRAPGSVIFPGATDARAIIIDGAFYEAAGMFELQENKSFAVPSGAYAMFDRVFDIRLNDHGWNEVIIRVQVRRYFYAEVHFFSKPQFLQVEVEFEELYFVAEGDGGGSAVLQRLADQGGKLMEVVAGAFRFGSHDVILYGHQAVENKMGVHLRP